MAPAAPLTLLLLLCSSVHPAQSSRKHPTKSSRKSRALRQKLRSGNNLGAWTEATAPLHSTVCGDHTCRPGEGNLKGYQHWSQPYESAPLAGLSKRGAHGWSKGSAFPSDKYTGLVAAAQRVQRHRLVAMTVADFDFRLLAENWYQHAQRADLPAIVHALDSEAFGYLSARGVATHNGTDNLLAWSFTKLQRHIQRALAEKHMAAAALVASGLDVLMFDSTHVPLGSPIAFLSAPQLAAVDLLAPRGECNAQKQHAGCSFAWNFLFLRGSAPAPRRDRIVRYMQAAVDTGMIDFYLRWWSGHHCIYMGYDKLFRSQRFTFERVGEPDGPPPSAQLAADRPNATAILRLAATWCGDDGACLRLGLLPANLFPPPNGYHAVRDVALTGRTIRPNKDPTRSHRLRLDRYDEVDFDTLREAMLADGLWRLGS